MNPKPVRLQRSRAKGSKLVSPNGLPVVCVTRPSRWGNPFFRGMDPFAAMATLDRAKGEGSYAIEFSGKLDAAKAVECYGRLVRAHPEFVATIRRELRGKNLACWCKLGAPCHADVLLEIANGGAK